MFPWPPRRGETTRARSDGTAAAGLPRALPELANLLQSAHEFPQAWVLCVPAELSAAERTEVQSSLLLFRATAMPIVEHAVDEPLTGTYPWVLFVDDLGVLRAAAEVGDPGLRIRVQRWSRLFRSR